MWLEGRRVAIVGVPGGWGGRGAVVRGAWLGRARGAPGVLRAAHRSWFGKGWGCWAVIAVCPPYLLQWEPWRRQGGFGEGWWCGWRGEGWRLRGSRGRFGRGGGEGWVVVWPGGGNPRRPPAGAPELVRGRRGLLGQLERSVPRIRCSGSFGGGRMVLGRAGGLAGGEEGYDCGGGGRLGREEVAVGVWFGRAMRNPRRPPANSPELVRGRRGLLGQLERSVPRIRCSGFFFGGRAVLERGVAWQEGRWGGDCRDSGRLGRGGGGGWGDGLAGRCEPPASSGRLTGAGPGKAGVATRLQRSVPRMRCSGGFEERRVVLGRGSVVAGGQVGGAIVGIPGGWGG